MHIDLANAFGYAAGALIFNMESSLFLLQLRGRDGDAQGTYGFFGGKLDGDESPDAAVRREVVEETGFEGPILLRRLPTFVSSDKSFTYHNFLGVVMHEFQPALNAESAGYIWFDYPNWPQPLHPGLEWLIALPETDATIKQFTGPREL
jgi:8-oxo-dGTP pyrophosphatase MutT (NUDIX family)